MMTQQMAPLPDDMLTPDEPPFNRVGIDYFGPLYVRLGRSTPKRYGVIFTCLACRAVHFEIAYSLDTDSFLGAFSRFVARRGLPKVVFSDNGTNLTAAEKELRDLLQNIDQDRLVQKHDGIEWNFLPPGASHMAGVWERLIKSTKQILRGLLADHGQRAVTDEVLSTLLCEVERIMNDRPISANEDSPDDEPALTPSMLLTFQRRPTIPAGLYDEKDAFSRRWWRQAQHLANVFWRRWIAEYLPTLQMRQKWTRERLSINVNDIVLVSDEITPRGEWPLGRIEEVIQGRDGLIRAVRVRVRGKVLVRPISRLCLLEQDHK